MWEWVLPLGVDIVQLDMVTAADKWVGADFDATLAGDIAEAAQKDIVVTDMALLAVVELLVGCLELAAVLDKWELAVAVIDKMGLVVAGG